MSLEEREFRNALSLFATGVVVVTAEVDDHLLGNTVSSFNSVSLSPPLILFSIARSAISYPLWRKVACFGVTVLGESQADLSNAFARGGVDKFGTTPPVRGKHGVPLLANGLATFECAIHAFYDGGDHDIVVGRVLAFETRRANPLIFQAGRYHRLRNDIELEVSPQADIWLHGW